MQSLTCLLMTVLYIKLLATPVWLINIDALLLFAMLCRNNTPLCCIED